MTSTTGKSQQRDPSTQGQDTNPADTTGELQLPRSSAAAVYSVTEPPTWTMSGLLGSTLCVATVISAFAVAMAIAEAVRGTPPVTHTTMLLLTAASATGWIAVAIIAGRDRIVRGFRSLRGSIETVQNRQVELYRRQDHLAQRITDITNRQVETAALMRKVAADIAAIRAEMADVLGVADADAELQQRRSHAKAAVNGRAPMQGGGLYVVPPEGRS